MKNQQYLLAKYILDLRRGKPRNVERLLLGPVRIPPAGVTPPQRSTE